MPDSEKYFRLRDSSTVYEPMRGQDILLKFIQAADHGFLYKYQVARFVLDPSPVKQHPRSITTLLFNPTMKYSSIKFSALSLLSLQSVAYALPAKRDGPTSMSAFYLSCSHIA
jgi:hypothetical protein